MSTTNSSPLETKSPFFTVDPNGIESVPNQDHPKDRDELYKSGFPQPTGIDPAAEARIQDGQNTDPTAGRGVDGEVEVWHARYSEKNFFGRIMLRLGLTVAWAALAVYTWGMNHADWSFATWSALIVVVAFWGALLFRMTEAYLDHYYQLTNRRLFVSTGVFKRRRDMMELLMVQDVFIKQQSLLDRWLNLGTVVVVPGEKNLPTFHLPGVNDPKQVMDLIWHHARAERDQRSLKVENI
jgi:membrane protein YdbS with pleckstrin-like domain